MQARHWEGTIMRPRYVGTVHKGRWREMRDIPHELIIKMMNIAEHRRRVWETGREEVACCWAIIIKPCSKRHRRHQTFSPAAHFPEFPIDVLRI